MPELIALGIVKIYEIMSIRRYDSQEEFDLNDLMVARLTPQDKV